MTTTWNNTSPAVGNQISADIPDILENFQHLKTGFQRIFYTTWSDSDLSTSVMDPSVGWSDGSYTYDFPTNGIAGNSIIMLGNSNTIVWFYLNTAPPGWKVLSTGADTVLAVAGGSSDYNANGGTAGGDWTTTHTHTGPSHTHTLTAGAATASSYVADTPVVANPADSYCLYTLSAGAASYNKLTNVAAAAGTGASGGTAPFAASRPSASIGKLFQLDTA